MEYHDTDPERRNLVLLSLGFLIYFVGEGNFKSGDINFQIINLHLNNPSGIAYISWGLLFWFFYRYMLKYYSSFIVQMNEELASLLNRQYLRNRVSKKLDVELAPYIYYPKNSNETEEGWVLTGMWYFNRRYHIRCSNLEEVIRDKRSGKIDTKFLDKQLKRGDISSQTFTFSGWRDWFVFLRLLFDYCFTKPNFSTNLFPILLFIAVVLIGLWRIC